MSSVWDSIQRFFRRGGERRKIEALMERKAKLTAKRELIYSEVQRLERREKELLEQGRESESNAQKKRLAAQLAGLRKDLERRNTAANVLNRHIDILSTHIHNLDLVINNDDAKLPGRDELNEVALRVDDILAKIKEDSDLVAGIESDRSSELMSNEEAAILAEFERGREAELVGKQLRLDELPAEPVREREPPKRERAAEPPSAEPIRTERERVEKTVVINAEKGERTERVPAATVVSAEPVSAADGAGSASAPSPSPSLTKREEAGRLTVAE
jgi:hypothetical protein